MDVVDVTRLVLFSALLVWMLLVYWRRRAPDDLFARPKDAAAICDLLSSKGVEASFVTFIVPVDGPPELSANVQFSVDDGVVGLDWVLLSPTNIRDVATFERLVSEGKHTGRRLTMNDVSYVRVEDGDIAALFQRALREMYDVADDDVLEVVVEGVTLPQSGGGLTGVSDGRGRDRSDGVRR